MRSHDGHDTIRLPPSAFDLPDCASHNGSTNSNEFQPAAPKGARRDEAGRALTCHGQDLKLRRGPHQCQDRRKSWASSWADLETPFSRPHRISCPSLDDLRCDCQESRPVSMPRFCAPSILRGVKKPLLSGVLALEDCLSSRGVSFGTPAVAPKRTEAAPSCFPFYRLNSQ